MSARLRERDEYGWALARSAMPSPLLSKSLLAGSLAMIAAFGTATSSVWGSYLRKPIVPNEVEVFFSPRGGGTGAVVSALKSARKSIYVQAYSFTSPAIARALVDAHQRGVQTTVILDKSQQTEKYTEADFLLHAGVPTFIDAAHSIAHNKVMILDEETVITGSFNFTRAAEENNAENLLIIHQTPLLAEKYLSNWQAHQRHSTPYRRR